MRRVAASVLLLCLLGLTASPVMAGRAVAQVDGCSGPAHVLSTLRRPLYLGDQIFAGERVALTPGTVLTVAFYADGHCEQVQGPGQFAVSRTGLHGPGVVRLAGNHSLALLPSAKRTMTDYIPRTGTLEGEVELLLRYPSCAAASSTGPAMIECVPSTRPQIRWEDRAEQGAVDVTMYLKDAHEQPQKLWQRTVQGNRLPYPADVPPLPAGATCRVEVQLAGSDDPGQETSADFTVASAAVAARIAAAEKAFQEARETDAADPTPYARMALIYLDNGALADAATVMEMLEAADPDEPGPHHFLRDYYHWMGWYGAASFESKALRRLGIDRPDAGASQTARGNH